MNILQRKIGHRRYLADKDSNVFIITWYDVVNFFTDRKAVNIKLLTEINAPLPLRMYCIANRGTVIFTDGNNFKVLESWSEEFKQEYSGDQFNDVLLFILGNYQRIREHSVKQGVYYA